MSKSLSVVSVLEKNRLDSDIPFLITLDVEVVDPETGSPVEMIYLVRNDEPVTVAGQAYQNAIFDINFSAEAGAQPNIGLSLTDITGAVQARMEQYGGGVGFKVTMRIVNAGDLTSPPDIEEFFEVIGANSSEYKCEFQLGAENEITKPFPRRTQRKDFCQWRYKSGECGYTGALPTCSLTLQGPNGCEAHGQSKNFSSYPGLNSNGFRYA